MKVILEEQLTGKNNLPMRTTLTDLLVRKDPLELFREYLLLLLRVEILINLVDDLSEKLKGVLLLPDVDRLAPQLEALPELLWYKILQL